MSLLTDWQVEKKPDVPPGVRLDFCPRCTRLQAIGYISSDEGTRYSETYICQACKFHFTKMFYR